MHFLAETIDFEDLRSHVERELEGGDYDPRCYIFARRHPETGEEGKALVVVHPPPEVAKDKLAVVRGISDLIDRTDADGFMFLKVSHDPEAIICAIACAACYETSNWSASIDRSSGRPVLGKFVRDLRELN